MNEEDLESLITLDDPGEDELGEDTFHQRQTGNTTEAFNVSRRPGQQTDVIDKDGS